MPILKKVILHPTCKPITLPKGMPNIIATDDPVTTKPKAAERNLSGTIRTAMGDTTDQNMACVQATPMRDNNSIWKLVDKKDVTWNNVKKPNKSNMSFFISIFDTRSINGNESNITAHA